MALGNLWIYLNGPKFIFGLNAGIIIQMIAKMEIMPLINAIDALMLANKEYSIYLWIILLILNPINFHILLSLSIA